MECFFLNLLNLRGCKCSHLLTLVAARGACVAESAFGPLLSSGGGQGGGSPGGKGAGYEGTGSWILKVAGSWRNTENYATLTGGHNLH